MNLDESIGKIEVDPKEEASVVEVFQDVLDKLSDVGKKDKLLLNRGGHKSRFDCSHNTSYCLIEVVCEQSDLL
jgi:hypothetical protein